MPIVEVSVVPVGTTETGVSTYVRAAIKVIEESDVDYEVNPMGTCMQGEWDDIFRTLKLVHEELAKMGCLRIVTTVKIDDRRDKYDTMHAKVSAVVDQL